MCIPPVNDAPAPHFALTAKIAARNGLKNLSMGMSADFAIAIQFGATHVRIGWQFSGRGKHDTSSVNAAYSNMIDTLPITPKSASNRSPD